jgi:hypothetical protein
MWLGYGGAKGDWGREAALDENNLLPVPVLLSGDTSIFQIT